MSLGSLSSEQRKRTKFRLFQSTSARPSAPMEASSFGMVCMPARMSANSDPSFSLSSLLLTSERVLTSKAQ
jgi:hypothetical protein